MKMVKLIFLFILVIVITASVVTISVGASSLLLGDADGDGEICITDSTKIQRDVAKIIEIDDAFHCYADVDSDGVITILDATSIQRWLVHFSVAYPIGEPLNQSFPTEEKETVHAIIPTESTLSSLEPPINSLSVIRTDKTVTVDGFDFNISKIPDAVTLDNSSGNTASFMLRNQALPDPANIHIEVVSEYDVRRIDYSDERYKETYIAALSGKAIGCDYLIRDDSGNDIAWVDAHCTNTVYPYQVSIIGLSGTASFSVDFYYRDVLLKRTSVTVSLSEGYGKCDDTKAIVREIESACWRPNMTDKEKMKAFAMYIKTNYKYSQMKCVEGAVMTALAARDLGLDSMLLYPGGEENQPCPRHLITYNLYTDVYVPGGHCACLVEFNDCTMRYDVQGQACVIRPYLY
ncbi:MAG: dockerin type I repeat-containing protein [Ruminococcus sp.]|nr:dockerin type I repeat-containing protein [Ruminococcus sp.]